MELETISVWIPDQRLAEVEELGRRDFSVGTEGASESLFVEMASD